MSSKDKTILKVVNNAEPQRDAFIDRRKAEYAIKGGELIRYKTIAAKGTSSNGEIEIKLANFAALIVEEKTIDDGLLDKTIFAIEGRASQGEGKPLIHLKRVEVPSSGFASMAWVINSWGARAVMSSGNTVKDNLRHAVQVLSAGYYTRRTVYAHVIV